MNWQLIKDTALKWGFLASSLGLAVLYWLYDRQGRKLDKALADAQRAIIQGKLTSIDEKSKISQEKFDESKKEYENLKRIHGDVLRKLGIGNSS